MKKRPAPSPTKPAKPEARPARRLLGAGKAREDRPLRVDQTDAIPVSSVPGRETTARDAAMPGPPAADKTSIGPQARARPPRPAAEPDLDLEDPMQATAAIPSPVHEDAMQATAAIPSPGHAASIQAIPSPLQDESAQAKTALLAPAAHPPVRPGASARPGPPGRPPRPARASVVERLTGRFQVRSRFTLVGIALFAVVLLVAVAGLRQVVTRAEGAQADQHARLLADARRLQQAGSCEGATLFVRDAAKLSPKGGGEGIVTACRVTLEARDHLFAAWRAAVAGERERALAEARKVGEATPYTEDAKTLIRELERQAAPVDDLGTRLWRHAALGELGPARALASQLPPARREETLRELARLEERGKGGPAAKRGAPTSLRPFESSLASVIAKLEAASFEDARAECRALRAASPGAQLDDRLAALDEEISDLAGLYGEGLRQVQAGAPAAVDTLGKALALCRALGVGGGLAGRLGNSLADALAARAQAEAKAGSFAAARQDLLQAQRYDPSSFPAAQGLRQLQEDASEVLSDAESLALRDGTKAARKLRQVLEMVGASDPLAARARKRLASLER